ncbi:hypothetical protein RE628_13710 [Paenibacillus sp. D2_2]|uniref:hypothetical protein n=1 Tax=Paenibacillus sp. D2_2 TaxID=3073092 RepID=UPI0028152C83|nr:hypothetical protein [Paenibacillus sp. D2_2]WMT43213.1 hypothetical protein RE628_13710 [Paenibacillus sp. D2_2]
MRKSRHVALLIALLLVFEMIAPVRTVFSNPDSKSLVREKLYFEWMGHKYRKNETGFPIVRMTKVDFSTGLFTYEDAIIDFIDTSTNYYFESAWGMNTKNPLVTYAVLKGGTTEKIIKYDSQSKLFTQIADRTIADGKIDGVYPDAGLYVIEKGRREYLVYSLATNKLIHKAKEQPKEHSNSFITNFLYRNYFDPEPSIGALYVEAGEYYDSKKNGYVTYPGEFPYEIKPDGSIAKLHSYKVNASDDFVYKKRLSSSVVFKQSKTKNHFKHELIINGQIRTLFETNTERPDYAFAVAQISPGGNISSFG